MKRSKASRNSKRSLRGRRPVGTIDEQIFFLIVTEGKTEARYFEHFMSATGPRIQSCDGGVSRVSLVKEARELRSKLLKDGCYDNEIDETWVVFDRDRDSGNPNDKQSFNQALELARRNSISVAYSNDSFELWFLLHFQSVSSQMDRRLIDSKLRGHLDYKHGDDIFNKINHLYPVACKRAQTMHSELKAGNCSPVDANPSTTVHLLTEKLRKNMH